MLSDFGPDIRRLFAAAEEFSQLGSWEQDLQSGETVWSDGMYRILGLEPDATPRSLELILDVVHPDDRARARAMLEMVSAAPESIPEEGLTTELRLKRHDGSVRELRMRGHVEYEGADAAYWVGIVQDVTDQRLTERELQAHYAVSQALRDWESFDEGVMDLLRRVGTALDYPMGSLWLCDPDKEVLVCRGFWSAPDVDPGGFEDAKRRLVMRPGRAGRGLRGAPSSRPSRSTPPPIRCSRRARLRSPAASPPASHFPPSATTVLSRSCRSTAWSGACRARASCAPSPASGASSAAS